ncbi:D-alanyl-D-alanine endopeptidase [Sulfurirhabdus autotrophica]|uniref:D-alanyl-D-alanine endopeptidase (Penicillin-binding protein 7) n=1 Tax=Sulfurirhabdus autotrophica TaxID=1706046 RepID=A0A4R3XX95_9PROT|nr:D-alanyl-D-alanine endopeptidase [Sulfurirhabdus autotrophica]TCV82888.1 D-alanyl-D-alanine endopeptidase (penicillin-binding protein 7) [Sulfurirhabdus autotrophica]
MRKILMAGAMLAASLTLTTFSVSLFAADSGSVSKTKSSKSVAKKSRVKKAIPSTHASNKRSSRHHAKNLGNAELDVGNGPLKLASSAAMVFDENNDKPLFAKNATTMQPIASITKLMTAMVVLDAQLPMDEYLTVENADVDTLRNSGSRLGVGTVLTRTEMLRLALMSSENRAASALGRTYPGGINAFVAAMNRKAASLGMLHSRFVDSSGLHSENVSTAEDLVKMVTAGYRYDLIREYTTTSNYGVELSNSGRNLEFNNTNALVKNKSKDWDIGLSKTGYISEAGRCLVMHVNISNRPMVIVLLDSVGKFTRIGDANRIKKWVENNRSGSVAASRKSSNDV